MTSTMTEAELLDFLDPFETSTPEQIAADRAAHEEAKKLIWIDRTCSCGQALDIPGADFCRECDDRMWSRYGD